MDDSPGWIEPDDDQRAAQPPAAQPTDQPVVLPPPPVDPVAPPPDEPPAPASYPGAQWGMPAGAAPPSPTRAGEPWHLPGSPGSADPSYRGASTGYTNAPPAPDAPAPGAWGAAPHPAYAAAPQPGIVPLRPMTASDILDGGFATLRAHPRVAFGYAAVLAALIQATRLVTGIAMRNVSGAFSSPLRTTNDGFAQTTHVNGAGLASTIVEQLLSSVFTGLLAGVVTIVVGKAVLGRRAEGKEVSATLRRRGWRLVLLGLLATFIPFAPLIVAGIVVALASAGGDAGVGLAVVFVGIPAVVLAIYAWVKITLAIPAFMLEELEVWAAVRRSWRLVKGGFMRVFGLRLMVTILVAIAGGIVSLLFLFLSDLAGGSTSATATTGRPAAALAIVAIGAAISWTIVVPLEAATFTLIYLDRRFRTEALDLQLARFASEDPAMARAGAASGWTANGPKPPSAWS